MITFYELFIQEVDALTIMADASVVHVVGELTRAAKRAQLVADGELCPVNERVAVDDSDIVEGSEFDGPLCI